MTNQTRRSFLAHAGSALAALSLPAIAQAQSRGNPDHLRKLDDHFKTAHATQGNPVLAFARFTDLLGL